MSGILDEIRKGMTVCDPSGAEIGTVDAIHLSDEGETTPGAQPATTSGQEQPHSIIDDLADAFRTDDVPEPLRARLLRHGFIRVDAAGLFAADRYVMPDQIASVSGDRVTLTLGEDELVKRT